MVNCFKTVKELRQIAKQNSINLKGKTKKNDILGILEREDIPYDLVIKDCKPDKICNVLSGRCKKKDKTLYLSPLEKSQLVELRNFLVKEQDKNREHPIEYSECSIVKFFLLIYVLKKNKNDCHVRSSGMFDYVYRSEKKTIENHEENVSILAEAFLRCRSRNKLLVVPLTLSRQGANHQNLLVFNHMRGEIEHYEPHGAKVISTHFNTKDIDKKIVELLVKPLKNKYGIKLKYIPADKSCPSSSAGFQYYESMAVTKSVKRPGFVLTDPDGFCMAWSFLYADLRIKFPLLSSRQINNEVLKIVSKDPEKLRSFLRGQTRFLEKEIDKASNGYSFKQFLRAWGGSDNKKRTEQDLQIALNFIKFWKDYAQKEFSKFKH